MITTAQIDDVIGETMYGANGDKIGKVGQIYLDDQTGQPEWATASTGMFGSSESFVPLAEASASGSELTVPYDKNKVKDASRIDPDQGHLSQDEEAELYRYYGLSYSEAPSDSACPPATATTTTPLPVRSDMTRPCPPPTTP